VKFMREKRRIISDNEQIQLIVMVQKHKGFESCWSHDHGSLIFDGSVTTETTIVWQHDYRKN
jgi:hypothetical protein